MKDKILKLLKESKGYISGQDLCLKMNVSRTAIWKAVNSLKEEGYEIEAVRKKGYRLVSSPDIISEKEIVSGIKTRWIAKKVIYFDELDSTNIYAKKIADEGESEGTLVISDAQISGKGRRQRAWTSPHKTGIFMTLILRPDIAPINASMLTLVMGLAVCKGVREITGLDLGIKWPNDIVINGKKICGILTEMSMQMDYINNVIIGTGINVGNMEFPEELQDKATSLKLEAGKDFKRSDIIIKVMEAFEKYYELFLKSQDLTYLVDEYNELLVNKDREVKAIYTDKTIEGTAKGINEKGELMVVTENENIEYIISGEVSVRGIYGYI
ncbi:BirA family transcriptional regulator, biotin operon repressor / biotin-[acetyl-CoA-carboxylase] ligase [Acetitomaculum ruminis DSM 5522]|uniref:Bifunctional ligase/repressor BirA n=1 Tax=Acetitomaculum ruminis DSM 5522 TaxID=1120918 RepID=A0A1I0X1P2_9FIRM|nr:biotin--[acetyl-CoA-carboxylase] ligase [Acetitomaculum ruminis]SFA94577.1 BirA family transcriptional regulator, biotin operon repressor / biotin-[acetyl-CoA-carboxylase] ligase [Acetitomaculum ruminis DSM 5522]